MAKGFFTQSACILLSRPASLDEIGALLGEFRIAKRIDDAPSPDMGGPSFTLEFQPKVNGYLTVDIQDRAWPDHMGDPKTEPMLLGAWSMGHFGPFAFPGNLRRAAQQSWEWEGARTVPEQHRAFIRIRSSYVFGAGDDAKLVLVPPDYDPLAELLFVTRVARALLRHPAALAYFNPNGETLRTAEILDESLAFHAERQLPPLDVWSNIRLFNPGNGWLLMDTVGMGQLDRPDCEACFPEQGYQPGAVDHFFRNCSLYLLEKGEVVKHGDTMDGPGGIAWRAHHVEEALAEPPRPVLRWFPVDGSEPPPEMTGEDGT
jgi:hypothetical protein